MNSNEHDTQYQPMDLSLPRHKRKRMSQGSDDGSGPSIEDIQPMNLKTVRMDPNGTGPSDFSSASSRQNSYSNANMTSESNSQDGSNSSACNASVKQEDLSLDDYPISARERRRRQKLPNKESLFCAVCGDKANGYNFGAITCESCKAFFRRNALKTKEVICNFENDCKIDPFTRKFCTACRLNKCFDINMKKEWILDEDALKKRKRLTRKTKDDRSDSSGAADSTQGGRGDSTSHEKSEDQPDCPPEPLSEEEQLEIQKILESHQLLDLPLDAGNKQAQAQYPAMDGMGGYSQMMGQYAQKPPGPNFVKDVNDRGYSIDINEFNKLTDQPNSPVDLVNLADGFIRRLIKFVKTLPEFSILSQEDQIQLLKGCIMETLVLRSAIQYDPNIDGFAVEDVTSKQKKDLKISFINQALGPEIYSEHMKFITSFNTAAKWDKPTMILAMIINLFSPDRQGLQNKEIVANAEEHYSFLLQAYLRSKYAYYEARSIYPKLLLKLTDVRSYGEMSAQHISQLSAPRDMEPLLKELFDVKSV